MVYLIFKHKKNTEISGVFFVKNALRLNNFHCIHRSKLSLMIKITEQISPNAQNPLFLFS